MSRPSDGMTFDELRDEFDWMFEFQSRMAERIRDDADVHNLVDYVTKLETENAKLWELVRDYESLTATLCNERECDGCPFDSKEHAVCEHMRLVARLGELEIEASA